MVHWRQIDAAAASLPLAIEHSNLAGRLVDAGDCLGCLIVCWTNVFRAGCIAGREYSYWNAKVSK